MVVLGSSEAVDSHSRAAEPGRLLLMNVICTVCVTSRYLLPRRSYFIKSARWNSSLYNMTDSTLSQFLSSSKDRYLIDLRHGKGRKWTVVMGNEAGGKFDQF